MRIEVRRESEVTERDVVILRLLHRTKHDRADDRLFRFPVNRLQNLLKRLRFDRLPFDAFDMHTKVCDEVEEEVELVRFRIVVDTIDERHVHLVEVFRNRLVGREHELLDQLLSDRTWAKHDIRRLPFLVDDDFRLGEIEVDRTTRVAAFPKDFRELGHEVELPDERFVLFQRLLVIALDDLTDVRIRHPLRRLDDTREQVMADDLPVLRGDLHDTAERQAVDVRVEGTDPVRESVRQHRNDAVDEIHTRPTLERLDVERRALFHVMRDVGDMDTELVVAVIEFFDVDGIVQVFRIFTVNREDRLVTKVDATDEVFLVRLVRYRVRLSDHVLRELRWDAVLIDDRQDVDAWVVLMPDDADDVTGTSEASVRILRDAYDDFMSVDGTE